MIDTAFAPDHLLAISVPAAIDAWLEGGMVTVNVGFDLAFEGRNLAMAVAEGRQLLSIRVGADEVLIGPRWVPGGSGACAGCAETRLRLAVDHPLRGRYDVNASARGGWPAILGVLLDVALNHLVHHPLTGSEMLTVGTGQTRRRRIVRSVNCPLCGPSRTPTHAIAPPPLALQSRPSPDPVPMRGPANPALGDEALRRLVDPRVGPVLHIGRDHRAPFAMSSALVPGARSRGYGRGHQFAASGRVAVLEAYERLGAVPDGGRVIHDVAYDEVREVAVDPATLGCYSQAQLDHPNARVREYRGDVPMDWVFGYQFGDGGPRLIPADVAFYGYEYPGAQRFFAESSSGCALGSSLEEAALHALLELIERDSFLLAWCRRRPLPAIDVSSVDDQTSRMLLDTIAGRGFDTHLLVTTHDLGLPSIWALAVNRSAQGVPATYSAAGSSPQPADAVRAALWELAQLVAQPVDWDLDAVTPLIHDPSLVDTIEDHVHLYAMPERRDRMTAVLGGDALSLSEAFPGWPEQLCLAAQGDVLGALDHLLARCREAGLDQALVIDQSTTEHTDLGLRVARVVVPGMLPMCFGSPRQRLAGLPRREQALATAGRDPTRESVAADLLLDPHPFP